MKPWLVVFILVAFFVVIFGIRIILLFIDLQQFTAYWRTESARQIEPSKNELIYLALGDSAAQGLGASQPTNGYVGQFAQKLAKQTGRPVRTINLSVSGAVIADVIAGQVEQIQQYKPDVITLDIGGNDIRTFDAKRFTKEMNTLMSKLPAPAIMSDLPYFGGRDQLPGFGSGESERRVVEANAILHDLAPKHGLVLANLHHFTQERNGRDITNYAVDYFHPNDKGYRAWTEAFWSAYSART